ncbi:hypothetical protein ACHAQH_007075 [Verticillium albo-atrum]
MPASHMPHLPTEVWWAILDFVREDHVTIESNPHVRAGYARVCRLWQGKFEDDNFRTLVLDQDRLVDFERYICLDDRRRKLVQRINLCVKLQGYDCTCCQLPESSQIRLQNNRDFIRTLRTLLILLSPWSESENGGITLDLGAYSPSDARHTFRDFRLAEDYPYTAGLPLPQEHIQLPGFDGPSPVGYDPCPARFLARRNGVTPGAMKRTISTICHEAPVSFPPGSQYPLANEWKTYSLPVVTVITALVTRRHYSRIISSNLTSKLLRQCLPNIETLHLERWRAIMEATDMEYQGLTHLAFQRPALKHLRLFVESTALQHASSRPEGLLSAFALGRACRTLHSLSAPFIIDARSFFHEAFSRVPPGTDNAPLCPNLEYLVLTTPTFRPDGDKYEMLFLLHTIKWALKTHMPRMKKMEIFNGAYGMEGVFRYTNEDGRRRFTWRGTFWRHFASQIFEQWAVREPDLELWVQWASSWEIRSYFDVMKELELVGMVLDPLSKFQMKWEHRQRARKEISSKQRQ